MDREELLNAIKKTNKTSDVIEKIIKTIKDVFSDDADIAKELISTCGSHLKLFSDRIRSDKSVVKYMNSVLDGSFWENDFLQGLEYASDDIKDDGDFILQISTTDEFVSGEYGMFYSDYFKHVSNRLKNDKEFILEFAQRTCVYEWLTIEQRSDVDICRVAFEYHLAIMNDGLFAYYGAYRNNKENMIYQLIPDDILCNKELMMMLSKLNTIIYEYLPKELQMDQDILANLIDTESCDLNETQNIPRDFKSKMNDPTEIYNGNSTIYGYAQFTINKHRHLLLECIKIDFTIFKYIPYEFRNDIEFISSSIENCKAILHYIPHLDNDVQEKLFDIQDIQKWMIYDEYYYIYPDYIKNNRDILLGILSESKCESIYIDLVCKSLQMDSEIIYYLLERTKPIDTERDIYMALELIGVSKEKYKHIIHKNEQTTTREFKFVNDYVSYTKDRTFYYSQVWEEIKKDIQSNIRSTKLVKRVN